MLRLLVCATALLQLGVVAFPGNKAMTQDKTHTAKGKLYEFSKTDLAYEGDFQLLQDAASSFLRLDVGNTTTQDSRNWRYTGIYTQDAYYEMGPQVRNKYGKLQRLGRGQLLCQKFTNWTYSGIAQTYSTAKGMNYMGAVNVKNDYATGAGINVDTYVGSVQRHPLHLDLTMQWIDSAGPGKDLRRGGINAMPGGWWMVYATDLSTTGPSQAQMELPAACKCPVRVLPNPEPLPAFCKKPPKAKTASVDEDIEEEVDPETLSLNWDFTTHHFEEKPQPEGLDSTRHQQLQDKLQEWSSKGYLPAKFKKLMAFEKNNKPQTTVQIADSTEITQTTDKRRVVLPQAQSGFRPFLKRVTTKGSGTETIYTGAGKEESQVGIEHLENVAQKLYRVNVKNKQGKNNETYITTASGAFYAFTDPSGKRKCEYTSTFNYDDLFNQFQTPPFEWFANFTFTNGMGDKNGPKDTVMGFATMEVPEFIGDFLFQRNDGVETYFVDVSRPTPKTIPGNSGPVTEAILTTASATAPSSAELELPAECKAAAKADCNYQTLEKCVLKATASTLLTGDTCAYMREMAYCFADNFCKEHLARLCSVQRAAKCTVKQCAFPAGGCPPAC